MVLIPFLLAAGMASAQSPSPSADEAAFRALYKELVEINTTRSVGNCTPLSEAIMQPACKIAQSLWPGVVIVPT